METLTKARPAPLARDCRLRFVREDGSEAFSEPLTGPNAMALAARFGRQIHCEIVPNTRSLAARVQEQGQGVSAAVAIGLATLASQPGPLQTAECQDPACPYCQAIDHAFQAMAAGPIVIHEGPPREECDCSALPSPISYSVQVSEIDAAGPDEPTARWPCSCVLCQAELAVRAAGLVIGALAAACAVKWFCGW